MAGDPRSSDDDPWGASTGHVGAAPPPSWGHDGATASPHETDRPDGAARQEAPHMSSARAARVEADNPYWSPAYDNRSQRAGRYRPPGRTYNSWGGRYRRTGYPWGNSGLYRLKDRAAAPGATFWVFWGIFAFATAGLASPIPAIIAWVRTRQSRRRSDMLGVASRFWLVSAIIWTAVTALVLVAYIGAAATSNGGNDSYQPPVVHNIALGTAVTVHEGGLTEHYSRTREPVTVTVSGFDRSTPGVTKVRFSICAPAVALDPLAAAFRLTINGPDNTLFSPKTPTDLPDAWYHQMPAHQCLQGQVPFAVPSPDIISNVTFGIDEQVVWPAS